LAEFGLCPFQGVREFFDEFGEEATKKA